MYSEKISALENRLPENCSVCGAEKVEERREKENADPLGEYLYWSRTVKYDCGAIVGITGKGFVGGSAFIKFGYIVIAGCQTALKKEIASLELAAAEAAKKDRGPA